MGTLVDAIHVGNGSHLELRKLRIPNCASRHVYKPSAHVRLRVAGIFALWPSITLAINSSVSALRPRTLSLACSLLPLPSTIFKSVPCLMPIPMSHRQRCPHS